MAVEPNDITNVGQAADAVAYESGPTAPIDQRLTIVLRPQLLLRVGGPACIVLAVAGIATGIYLAALLLPVGICLIPSLFQRVEVNAQTVRQHGLRGWQEPVDLGSLKMLRLRRVPWPPLANMRRAYRLGPFCSVPLRLTLATSDQVVLQLVVAWWSGWVMLTRFVAALPDIDLDRRSKTRLELRG